MDILRWLQEWYAARCDGEWEFREGLKILSVSNPGWSVEINVSDTVLEDVTLEGWMIRTTENDWYGYFLKDALFVGCGDPSKLETILILFRQLIEQGPAAVTPKP